jgi:hypothetical protein
VEFKSLRHLTNDGVRELYAANDTVKLTRDQKLITAIINKCEENGIISDQKLSNLQKFCDRSNKFKIYLKIKRLLLFCLVTFFTKSKLTKLYTP